MSCRVVSSKALGRLPLTVPQDRRVVARYGYSCRTGVQMPTQHRMPSLEGSRKERSRDMASVCRWWCRGLVGNEPVTHEREAKLAPVSDRRALACTCRPNLSHFISPQRCTLASPLLPGQTCGKMRFRCLPAATGHSSSFFVRPALQHRGALHHSFSPLELELSCTPGLLTSRRHSALQQTSSHPCALRVFTR